MPKWKRVLHTGKNGFEVLPFSKPSELTARLPHQQFEWQLMMEREIVSQMADLNELRERYQNIPKEMAQQRRWVCYKIMARDGKKTKVPFDPHTGSGARSNDKSTWGDFEEAISACVKYNLDGLGFELGDGICGIDLDNHPDSNGECLSQEDFGKLSNEFVRVMNSYTEWSVSGNGVHIFFYGKLPKGRRKTTNVEMYDDVRFFAMTGKNIGKRAIAERSEQASELWKKYVDDSEAIAKKKKEIEERNRKFIESLGGNAIPQNLSDVELIRKAEASQTSGAKFARLMKGDCSDFEDDHSRADQSLCNMLAFYSNRNVDQIDRIFRTSGLMREKWDSKRGDTTYGRIVIQNAIDDCNASYVKVEKPIIPQERTKNDTEDKQVVNEMNIDEDGEPIFRININAPKRKYHLDDTGNANRFYDSFGEHFHWNATDKIFMFWTGKTWVYDYKGIIRKYANQLIENLRSELSNIDEEIKDCGNGEDEFGDEMRKKLQSIKSAYEKNITRISNKAGKDAMLSEFQTLGKVPTSNEEYDKNPLLLNTNSGVVDLRTGNLMNFDRKLLLSKNTNLNVSYEEPKEWIKFLYSIFERGNEEETKEIVECLQRCIGYTLSGLENEQVMFLLYGGGSNGKSTLATVLINIMGDYYKSIDSSQLMVQKNQSVAVQYSLAELQGARYVVTQETDRGAKLSESVIKQITGADPINAQRKYGKPFSFVPNFKLWMMTNNLPIISGTDYGIWRRIFLFPFRRQFKDNEKDKELPNRLAKEYPQILGWAIQGCVKYLKDNSLHQPECLKKELYLYQNDMDIVAKFINSECQDKRDENLERKTSKNDLYKAFKAWSFNNNEYAMPESKFSDDLSKKGFVIETDKKSGIRYYLGIILNENTIWTDSFPKKKNSEYEEVNPFTDEL